MLTLSPAAARAFERFEADLEPRLAPDGGDLGHVSDWGSKLAGHTARIAGLLHVAEHLRDGWRQPLSAETVGNAIAIAGYLVEHALAVFDLMGADPGITDARYLLAWIERAGGERFTRRDLFSALPRSRFPKVADLDPPLAVLVDHGYILREETPAANAGPGRKPSPTYLVNPHMLSAQSAQSAQWPRRPDSADTADCADKETTSSEPPGEADR